MFHGSRGSIRETVPNRAKEGPFYPQQGTWLRLCLRVSVNIYYPHPHPRALQPGVPHQSHHHLLAFLFLWEVNLLGSLWPLCSLTTSLVTTVL